MIRARMKGVLAVALGLALAFFLMESAQAKLTGKQKALMKRGRVEELAKSLTRGMRGRVEKASRLYLFVRDEIRVFEFKEQRSAGRVLMDRAGREKDKARLLSRLLKGIKEKGYLATINLVKYGEDQSYSFVVMKVTKKEAEAMSKITGGKGEFIRFPLKRERGRFIPLVPLGGYSIGRLSTDFYKEVKEGNGQWKKWKYNVSFARF